VRRILESAAGCRVTLDAAPGTEHRPVVYENGVGGPLLIFL